MQSNSIWSDQVPTRDGVRSPIHDVAISPDGQRIIIAVGNRVLLYNAEIGDLIESLRGHKDTVYCVDFSADGTRFSSGGADNIVIIWKISGQGLLKYNHSASIQKVKYNPKSMLLASCSEVDFGLWTPDQKQVVKEKMPAKILSAAWSCDGTLLAIGLLNGWVMIRDSGGQELHRIERRAPIWCLQFIAGTGITPPAPSTNKSSNGPGSPTAATATDADLLVVGCWDKTLSLYKVTSQGHRVQGERNLRYYPCGLSIANLQGSATNFMVISGSNRKVTLYSRDGIRLADLTTKDAWVWACATHGESDRVVIGSDNGAIDVMQMSFEMVHDLFKDRYAYRENLTEVVVHHLVSDRRVRIKCRDYVQRISLYKNKLAVQLSDKVCIYESNPEETQDLHFRLRKERIQASNNIPCEHLIVLSNNVVFCTSFAIQLYTFDGHLMRTWTFEFAIGYVKVNGGPDGREALLIGLENGAICKVFADNPFPIELANCKKQVKKLDLSLYRDKIAIVDVEKNLLVLDLKTQNTIYTAAGVTSVYFNTEIDDMLCYSGETSHFIVSGIVSSEKEDSLKDPPEAQEQNFSGVIIGFSGQKVFCLHKGGLLGIDIPQGGNMMRHIDIEDYPTAYHIACLGVTESEWRLLGIKALRSNRIEIAKHAFAKLKDSKFMHLIEEIEREAENGSAAQPATELTAGRRNRNAAASTQQTSAASGLSQKWQAEILAYEGHHNEAAKLYARMGRVDEAIRVFTDMRMWNEAKLLAESSGIPGAAGGLVQQQAKWLQEINDWKGAAEIFVSMAQYNQAAKIILDSGFAPGWQNSLIHVVRSTPVEQNDVLNMCGEAFARQDEDVLASETYSKVGNISKLMELYIKKERWNDAAKLANEYEGKFDSAVFLPYAEWLISQDRFEDAMQGYKKAGRLDLSRRVLSELTFNSVVENRFKDASYYYWLMSKEYNNTKEFEYQLECEHKADLYFAYAHIHAYVTDPFTAHQPDLLFQVARFILNSMGTHEKIPYGISKSATLYTLAKEALHLGAFKLARYSFDKLMRMQIPAKWQDEIDHDILVVQAKPVRDEPDLLPCCFRCGSINPLLNPFTSKFAKGDMCTNCGHPFVRSFINFDILPLVEFVPDPSITDEEAIEFIRSPPSRGGGLKITNKWNESKNDGADVLALGSDSRDEDDYGTVGEGEILFTQCLNRTLDRQANATNYIPITVDMNTLVNGIKRSEVYVCKPSSPDKRATFYKNMLPDIAIAISQSCHRFFHLEDFEFAYLSNKSCPYSRVQDIGEYGAL